MREWGGKLAGATLRIAALIHIANCSELPWPAHETPITEKTMRAAVEIAEYLSKHAEAVYGQMGADATTQEAKYILKRIVKSGKSEFSKRDIIRLCKGHFGSSEEMDAPLRILEERGYIRQFEEPTKGRPSKRILKNPLYTD